MERGVVDVRFRFGAFDVTARHWSTIFEFITKEMRGALVDGVSKRWDVQ